MSRFMVVPFVILFALAPAVAAETVALPNAFYPMDTAIQQSLANLDLVKELGFDGAGWFLQEPDQVKAAVAEMRKRGLRMFALYGATTIDPKGELQVAPQFPGVMKALNGQGTTIWLIINGNGPAIDKLDGNEPFVKTLRELADTAKANGLRVAIYPHVGNYTARFADATKVAKVVNHSHFGVTLTLCHSLAGGEEERLPALLKEAGPLLFSVTINGADKGLTGANWDRLIQTLDKGTFDVQKLLCQLAELGYMGPIGFQGYGIKGEPRAILTPTMAAWKKLSESAAKATVGDLRRIGDEKIKVLLVGGRGHDWKGFHAALEPVLAKTGHFELVLTDKLDDLKAENISKYKIVLFYGSGGDFENPAQEQGLGEFVKKGGGLVGVHATDAFKQSDLYWRLLGSRFTTHGGGQFQIRIENKTHPITAPIGDFQIEDESYQGDDHPAFKLYNLGRIDRGAEQQSMIWVQSCGKGRIFNTTLGHGEAAWKNPSFQQLVVRGLYWAAGYEPADPR